jgi:hypothetical protein
MVTLSDQLAKLGSECQFTGPEPACGISARIAKKTVWDWTNRGHQIYWESLTGLKQAKGFLQGPSGRRTKEVLKLNRNQLRWVTGLLTGHCHLKGRLFKMGLTNSPICERFLEKDESATHIQWDCEAIAYLRFRHHFMEPGDLQDSPICKILHFIRSVGLLEG